MAEQKPPRSREQQLEEQGYVDAAEHAAHEALKRGERREARGETGARGAGAPPANPESEIRNPKSEKEVK